MEDIRAKIEVRGIVQGVGYRPFIHKLVRRRGLNGWVKNTSRGVELELEGAPDALRDFAETLRHDHPPLAVVESVELTPLGPAQGEEGFAIIPSTTLSRRNTLISPDVAPCDDCLRELFDPNDRRYGYPFLNCTNCGPRFTIVKDVPYDRPYTTMSAFTMCPDCADEYGDIDNRRYHAQPNCCPDCGPQLRYCDEKGDEVGGEPLDAACACLRDGGIVAIKGLGGFHLACRCDDETVVQRLRERKHREEKPLAIMCRDAEAAKQFCILTEDEERVLTSFHRPIVLLKKKQPYTHLTNNGFLGVMLPYTPLHHLLMQHFDALVMTSANLSDIPICKDNDEALRALRGIADGYLLHNRDIETRCDDSLLWVYAGREYFARRSRGYVPYPVTVEPDPRPILACGAEQKASFCVSEGNYAFPSGHIGDLKNLETLENYTQQIRHFERLFDIHPAMLVCDDHPDYLSTRYARERAKEEHLALLSVQHHHAHMASCMADNRLEDECLGVIWDGTGLGTDGTIWGGEFFAGGYESIRRMGTIRPIPLIGGDKAVGEIWRIAYAMRRDCGLAQEGKPLMERMLARKLNCPVSTGMGRLFDGVCAMLGLRQEVSYEGQGAVLLEAAAVDGEEGTYPIAWSEGRVFDWRGTVRAVAQEQARGVETGVIAARFMNTLVEMAAQQCRWMHEATGFDRVVLSGGVFQNQYLLRRLPPRLMKEGLQVFCHSRVSCNDEGLSLGQLEIAKRGGGTNVFGSTPENH
ncbi:MAG: carbamoyltransferase HypF [Clostridiales bacterium]|nr:carbamoyltransferase HypF [Candidatus Cacconaster stercorequi]